MTELEESEARLKRLRAIAVASQVPVPPPDWVSEIVQLKAKLASAEQERDAATSRAQRAAQDRECAALKKLHHRMFVRQCRARGRGLT